MTSRFARWRHAICAAVLPSSGSLPGLETRDLRAFFARLDARGPLHLRAALSTATVVLGAVVPFALGNLQSFDKLSAERQNALLERVHKLPLLGGLVEVMKLVACLAYFDALAVQRRVRAQGRAQR